jgi:hypothetical protein
VPSFNEHINEASKKPRTLTDIKKELSGSDFDMADEVYMKKGELVVIDTFFYGEAQALKRLTDAWSTGGDMWNYFMDNYGIELEVTNTFSEFKAKGRHKKVTNDGIVGVHLKIASVYK